MNPTPGVLQPLPYHSALRNYLKSNERELWKWMSSTQAKINYTENLRLELLKSTYRLDRETHEALYRSADEAKARLGLTIPLTVYQAQHTPAPNAALYYIPDEGHIVFSGPLMSLLSPEELTAVIGHELAHYVLWQEENGEYLITDRLLQTILHDGRAAPSHVQSARWFQLYTEIYCDRGALLAAGQMNAAISGLVKTETGLSEVSAASYLKQANEIFQNSKIATEQLTHPEAFMRARALALWVEQGEAATAEIATMVEGSPGLDEYDLLLQTKLTGETRQVLEEFLAPKWFQTDAVLGHARMFFEDFEPRGNRGATKKNQSGPHPDRVLDDCYARETSSPQPEGEGRAGTHHGRSENARQFQADGLAKRAAADKQLRNYLCYLLLDFVVADAELSDTALAAAVQFSKGLGIESEFERVAGKELKLKARDLTRIKNGAAELLAKLEASA